MSEKALGKYLFAAVLVLGFGLRLWGVRFGLPDLYHADEPIVVNHALAYGTGDLNPHFFKIPPLVSYLLFFCYGVYYLMGRGTGWFSGTADFETLFYADPSSFYLIARILFGVCLGTFSIYLLYRLVSRYSSTFKALLASLLFAVCFLHVKDSHYLYADIPLVTVLIAGFYCIFRVLESPALKNHLWAGAFVGLAAAVKYNGAALLIPYLAAFCYSPERKFSKLTGAGLTALAVYSLGNPYGWLDFGHFWAEIRSQAAAQGGVEIFHHLRYSLWEGMTPALLIISLAGAFQALRSRQPALKITVLWVAAYYLILIFGGQHYDRYVLPLIPFLCWLAAEFIAEFRSTLPVGGLTLLLAVAVLPNLKKDIHFNQVMSAPDVRTQSREWIVKNIPSGSAIALEWDFYMPRLRFSPEQLKEKELQLQTSSGFTAAQKRRLDYLLSENFLQTASYNLYFLSREQAGSRFLFAQPLVPYDLAALKSKGIEYVVTGDFGTPRHPLEETFLQHLQAGAQLVASFNPYSKASGIERPVDRQPLTGGPTMSRDLENRQRNGQPLRIYKIS